MRLTENAALASLKWVSHYTELETQVFCGFILLELLFSPIWYPSVRYGNHELHVAI